MRASIRDLGQQGRAVSLHFQLVNNPEPPGRRASKNACEGLSSLCSLMWEGSPPLWAAPFPELGILG